MLTGLLTFAAVYFVFVATPGPGLAAIVARGLASGASGSLAFLLGFVAGDLTWFLIASTGLAALASSFEMAFHVLKYAGCAYLLYVAWGIWHAPVAAAGEGEAGAGTGGASSFASSYALTLGNPKVIVFFLSITPLVVDVAHMNLLHILFMGLVIAVVCGGTITAYLHLANRARRVFRSETALRRINRGAAGIMAGVAAIIASRA